MSVKIESTKASKLILPELFHISFNGELQGVWDPEFNQKPDENHPEEPDPNQEPFPYPEPNIGRISVAPTIEGCFIGVYPNVSKYFEKENYPYMQFHIYVPVFKGTERVVTPKTLTKDRLVWDAVATQEHLILDEVQMNHWGVVEIQNTNKATTAYIHPFGDKTLPKESIGPNKVTYTLKQDNIKREIKRAHSFSVFK